MAPGEHNDRVLLKERAPKRHELEEREKKLPLEEESRAVQI
jgi:hypothetical protein